MSSFGRSLQIMALDCNSSITKGENNGNLHSPVTNLAMNLSELRTDRSTPKRRLSLNTVDSGPILSDCFKDSPTPFYSPSEEYRTKPQNPSFLKQSSLTNSEAPPLFDVKNFEYVDSPLETEQDDSNSRDSGLGYEKERDIEFLQRDNSPKKTENERDDGFSDHLETMDTAAETVSDSIKSLIEAPLSSQALENAENTNSYRFGSSLDDTPTTMRVAKSIFRTQSFDVRRRSINKRDRIKDENTPVYQKRRRPTNGKISPILKRSHSETEAQIKAAVQRISHNPSLIGDASKTYCLPTITGKHGYLKSVTPQTVKELLHGHYDYEINSYSIIDCRYPYEFEGGHIKKAENLYDENSIYKKFLENPPKISDSAKRDIVVFHCEFSSERAPKLAKFLRSRDRNANESCYPFLYYPEIYILDGGYKAFFEKCVEFCEPPTYKPMLHSDHSSDLKHFRGKSRSWAGERTHRSGLRQLNF
ncbi:M-phase inducer phosphatase 1 isoform X2 [Octopus bimaculoides]|uniref:M-phase inducer phosphatase 1 isoform X2 n=1 Tax=Octopus bimaculoides TaxID=37653 RepID=UPI00071D40F0|nr:M-phase inducer phosphatase 1 isoform X2 [Octopus bimaculoides]|eukprot:XP_014786513.1 PREDICTED: M-phase inducer phosphatase 1-like isoform X3 [Octopus bimaculoides]